MVIRKRHKAILDILSKKEVVAVKELATLFDVSEVTIRRDLSYLERQGLIQRVRGGAKSEEAVFIGTFRAKSQFNLAEKKAIAQKALELLPPNANIVIDNGTTVLQFARLLRNTFRGNLITNSIEIAREVAGHNISVIICGGEVNIRTGSLVGPKAEEFMREVKADYAFVGASGISPERGFCASDSFEAGIKATIVKSASNVIVLADHTKFNRNALFPFASLSDVTAVITDEKLPESYVEMYSKLGLKIIIAKASDSPVDE